MEVRLKEEQDQLQDEQVRLQIVDIWTVDVVSG
jgi:hypothetical protein